MPRMLQNRASDEGFANFYWGCRCLKVEDKKTECVQPILFKIYN